MSGITIQNLLEALRGMYSMPVPENYKQLDTWLNKFQRSQEAWSIIDTVFSSANLPEHAYFFAAQTLKTKLSFDFEEIKRLDLSTFRVNLLSLLHRYSQVNFIKSEIVARQLCLSLAIFALHVTEEWGDNMIQEIQESLSGLPVLFLEVLKCLAEEVEDEKIVVDDEKKNALKHLLSKNTAQVITLLQKCLEQGLHKDVLTCFLSWLSLGLAPESTNQLIHSPLAALCFEALKYPEHFSIACNSICELIKLTKDIDKAGAAGQTVIFAVLELVPGAIKAMENEEDDIIEGYAKIFSHLGRSHLELILRQTESSQILRVPEMLFRFSDADNIFVLKEVSRFWHIFGKKFNELFTDPQVRQERLVLFNNFLQQFLPQCLKLLKLKPEVLNEVCENKLSYDDEIEEKRYYISGILIDITAILGYSSIYTPIHNELTRLLVIPPESQDIETVSQIEALITALTSLSETATEEYKKIIQGSVNLLLTSRITHLALILACLKLFSSITKYISEDNLSGIMNYLVNTLTQPSTTKVASTTFKDICKGNATRLLKYLDSLLKLHSTTMELPGFSQKNILEGISRVLWNYKDDMTEYMRLICAPYLQSLQEIMTASTIIESSKLENKLCEICDRITIFIKGALDEDVDSKPVALLFRNLWDILKQLLPIFRAHADAVERLCRIVKHCMRKIGDDFIEYLPEFTQIIVVGFHEYMHSTYLYMAENIVRTFTSHTDLQPLITYLFTEMVKTTLLKLNSFEALRDNPEVTEDFFGMMIRYLNYCPQAVIESKCLPQAVMCATIGIGIDHIEVARCMYGFLENLLDYSDRSDARYLTEIEEVVLHYYKEVLNRSIQAVVEVMPGEVFDCIVDLITRTSEILDITNWLNESMSLIPHYTLTESEKQKLVQCAKTPNRLYSWFHTLHKRAKSHKLTVKE